MALSKDQCLRGRTFPQYFTELSANYARATGNSTYKVIEKYLRTANPPVVSSDSIVNDNACGPGIVTAAIIDFLGHEPKSVVATDSVPAMVNAAKHRAENLGWHNVKVLEMDSHELSFPDDTFTLSLSNMNVSTYRDPVQCLQEMCRTLTPDGIAVVTIWKRFALADLIHAAQKLVRADADLMKVPKAEFMQDGYLQGVVEQAGYKNVKTQSLTILCQDGEVEGLREFMLGDFTRTVRAPWTEAEREQWPGAVETVIKNEVARRGGIEFEAWVVTAQK